MLAGYNIFVIDDIVGLELRAVPIFQRQGVDLRLAKAPHSAPSGGVRCLPRSNCQDEVMATGDMRSDPDAAQGGRGDLPGVALDCREGRASHIWLFRGPILVRDAHRLHPQRTDLRSGRCLPNHEGPQTKDSAR
jgi:hypothetical protein